MDVHSKPLSEVRYPEPGSFYYNAPLSLILTSPFYSGRSLQDVGNEVDPESPEKLEAKRLREAQWAASRETKKRVREAESAKRREINAEYRRLASIAAKAKFVAEATAKPKATRGAKREVMLDTTPNRGNSGWIKAYPPVPEKRKKRKRSERSREKEMLQAREKRNAQHRAKILALDETYVQAETIKVVSTAHAVKVALRTGLVPGVKVGIKWYCDPNELIAYCLKAEQRRLAGLAASRAKILETRRAKAHDKRNVSTTKGDSE